MCGGLRIGRKIEHRFDDKRIYFQYYLSISVNVQYYGNANQFDCMYCIVRADADVPHTIEIISVNSLHARTHCCRASVSIIWREQPTLNEYEFMCLYSWRASDNFVNLSMVFFRFAIIPLNYYLTYWNVVCAFEVHLIVLKVNARHKSYYALCRYIHHRCLIFFFFVNCFR